MEDVPRTPDTPPSVLKPRSSPGRGSSLLDGWRHYSSNTLRTNFWIATQKNLCHTVGSFHFLIGLQR